ncbi:Rv2175c family DNA-binding protein [Frigoribacterium sp. 2-23]|uniref:Rv2175c family DNA-binding protein n=1 Tax=Frigoribacterium sp. 2-23 TaxID=3415006 RepID=UPI003C701B5A
MIDFSQRPWFDGTRWLTVPDLVERLGVSVGRVRRLLEDHVLLGARIDGVLRVPEGFLRGDEPLHELKGTITVLFDNAFTEDEALDWMLSVEESLGVSPLDALLAGRKAEVRRVAQSLL